MNIIRLFLFLIGCIGSRLLFAYIAKTHTKYLSTLGYLALMPAIGFSYIFLTNTRKTGPEVFGQNIWWNFLRPIHAILYFFFAYNAIEGNKKSWIYIFVDTLIGLIAWSIYHLHQVLTL